jgi:hypothetical protein
VTATGADNAFEAFAAAVEGIASEMNGSDLERARRLRSAALGFRGAQATSHAGGGCGEGCCMLAARVRSELVTLQVEGTAVSTEQLVGLLLDLWDPETAVSRS